MKQKNYYCDLIYSTDIINHYLYVVVIFYVEVVVNVSEQHG